VTTVAVEKQYLLHILSLSVALGILPAKRMCRIIYTLVTEWPYHIYPHYRTNGTILGKRLLNIEFVWIFSTAFL